MIAVERVRSYCEVPSEAPRDTDDDKTLPESWPAGGQISFENASLRYRPGLPLVLKSLKLEIPPGSKIGVVGEYRRIDTPNHSIKITHSNTEYRYRYRYKVVPALENQLSWFLFFGLWSLIPEKFRLVDTTFELWDLQSYDRV